MSKRDLDDVAARLWAESGRVHPLSVGAVLMHKASAPQPTKVIARWESRSGKHFVEALADDKGIFGFKANASSGWGYTTAEAAIERAEKEASFYEVKMKRVL